MRRLAFGLCLCCACASDRAVPGDNGEAEEASGVSGASEAETTTTSTSTESEADSDSESESSSESESTTDAEPYCGDGKVDPGEQCDGDDLQGFDCEWIGFSGGELLCHEWCAFDTSMCTIESPPFDTGYLPCPDGICPDGSQCFGEADHSVCMPLGCNSACPCPLPESGDSLPSCGPAFGLGSACRLPCGNGQTCPDGMGCFVGHCGWPTP